MRYLILIFIAFTFIGCFETIPDLEETPFEEESNLIMLEVTGDLTQVYLGNEWETFIYLQADVNYIDDQMFIIIYRDGRLFKNTTLRASGYAQFYDKVPYNSSHCYDFAIGRIDGGGSKKFVTDYCIDFK